MSEKLRRAFQILLDKERLHMGNGREGHLNETDLKALGAAIGEFAHVKTEWTVEFKYPHWDGPEYASRDEHAARRMASYHRARGATVRLLRQDFYAGPQSEVEL